MRVTSEALAGKRLCVHDAILGFDEQGQCVGVIGYADGRRCDPPEAVRPEDLEVLRHSRLVTIEAAEEAPVAPAVPQAEEAAAQEADPLPGQTPQEAPPPAQASPPRRRSSRQRKPKAAADSPAPQEE